MSLAENDLDPARASRFGLGLLIASLVLTAPALGFVGRYSKGFFDARAGKSSIEQRLTMLGPAPFKRSFLEFCEAVKQTVPAGERILVEPHRVLTTEGRARWYLYMNLELHPRQVFVRSPELASGTLVDYPRWLKESVRSIGVVESIERNNAIDKLGIQWRIRYSAAKQFRRGSAYLERRVESRWEPVELPEIRFAYGKVLDLGGEASTLGLERSEQADDDGPSSEQGAEAAPEGDDR